MTAQTLESARQRLQPYVERANRFSGWMPEIDSWRLTPRPWDYIARARELLGSAESVIDLGTGGGERFSELIAAFRGRAVGTEEWPVNARVAAARLQPLGASLVYSSASRLPFAANSLDLVLDRHEDFEPADIARVLKPGGTLLTQQCWNLWTEIDAFFPRRVDFGDHFRDYQDGLKSAGLELIDARSDNASAAFPGLGDLVFMLLISPWDIPKFDPLGADLEALLALEAELMTPSDLPLADGSYIIEAKKPR